MLIGTPCAWEDVSRLLRRFPNGTLGTPSRTFRRGSVGSAVVSETALLSHCSDPSQRQKLRCVTFSGWGFRNPGAMFPWNRSSFLLVTLQQTHDLIVDRHQQFTVLLVSQSDRHWTTLNEIITESRLRFRLRFS